MKKQKNFDYLFAFVFAMLLSVLALTLNTNNLIDNRVKNGVLLERSGIIYSDIHKAQTKAIERSEQIQSTYLNIILKDGIPKTTAVEKAESNANLFDSQIRQKTDAYWDSYYLKRSVGRLIIPNLVNMPIVYCSPEVAQSVVDSNVIAILNYYNIQQLVRAHSTTGFNGIKRVIPNQTKCYIDGQRYLCTARFNGINTKRGIADANGNLLTYGGYILYTCNDATAVPVTVVYVAPI